MADTKRAGQTMGRPTPLEMLQLEWGLAGRRGGYAGVDEAGRGALAGPVVAAAVILGGQAELWSGVDDSKRLSKPKREEMSARIREHALAWAIGMATVEEIDRYNILHASRLAMGRALMGLSVRVDLALVDGTHGALLETGDVISIPVVDGDARCLSIAAASILAKVERDRWMECCAEQYPQYGFAQHAGYGTPAHLRALAEHGPCPLHRLSFGPVQRCLQGRLEIS